MFLVLAGAFVLAVMTLLPDNLDEIDRARRNIARVGGVIFIVLGLIRLLV